MADAFNIAKIKLLVLLAVAVVGPASLSAQEAAAALAQRILGPRSVYFEFAKIDALSDQFTVSQHDNKIRIEGNNDNSMAMGLNYYLRHYAGVCVSWYADQPVQLPDGFPPVPKPVTRKALVEQRFFLNYCTFGYTMVWWWWPQWERFIDWMALNGINMPLALTGQEAVWQEVWREMGVSQDSLKSYFSGPAHLPWHRMANLDGFGGPLPQGWIDGQKQLQKWIVERERELGMTPVLPAFAGHVPRAMAALHPEADIKPLSGWCGFEPTWFLASTDPLFPVIQRKYLEKQTQLYGTSHIYCVDPFNEMDPPSWQPDYLASVARGIYNSLYAVDPQAQWLQMTWVFYYKRKQWTPERLRPYLTAVPAKGMLLLDYFCENTEVWRATDGFYGQPFVWCYLGNFGGNTVLAGDVKQIDAKLGKALAEAGKNMKGIGSTLESFDCSPHTYEFLFDRAWSSCPEPGRWVQTWSDARVGRNDANAREMWTLLADSVYRGWAFYGLGSQVQARPTFTGHGTYYTKPLRSYRNGHLQTAWLGLSLCVDSKRDSYNYDLVNLASQWLANCFGEVRDKFAIAYACGDVASMRRQKEVANMMLRDMDRLLSSYPSFIMGRWIRDARSWGKSKDEKTYYEQQARTLLTVWGGPVLNDYANRLWGGLVKDYYAARWNMFFDEAIKAVEKGRQLDSVAFDKALSSFEHSWCNSREAMPVQPTYNTAKVLADIVSESIPVYFRDADLLSRYMERFPRSQLIDVYKYCYQDFYGPAHLSPTGSRPDSAACAAYMERELQLIAPNDSNPDYQYTAPMGKYVRVNLRLVRDGVVPLPLLTYVLLQSMVQPRVDADLWRSQWRQLMVDMDHVIIKPANFVADSAAIAQLLEGTDFTAHHSEKFNQTYHYHYRIIEASIFEKQIKPLIDKAR